MEMTPTYKTQSATSNTDLTPAAVKFARRMMQLASQGDKIHTVTVAFINGQWMIVVNGGQMEKLGQGGDLT